MRTTLTPLLLALTHSSQADNNFLTGDHLHPTLITNPFSLTGSNDVIAVVDEYGELKASPFSVQFGKKDIWLPRLGHIVNMTVNGEHVPVGMVLDKEGRAYFPTQADNIGKRQYRFWSALLGLGDGNPKHRTTTATASQLARLGLLPGLNDVLFQVTTATGTVVTTHSKVHLISNTSRIVVSDAGSTSCTNLGNNSSIDNVSTNWRSHDAWLWILLV